MAHKERINYIRDGEYFIGHPVNIKGVTVQATSLEDLKEKTKMLCNHMIDFHKKTLDQDEPFELYEETDGDVWLYGEPEAKMRKELQRYKDTFGDI